MYQTEYNEEENTGISRSEKVLEAKAAFLHGSQLRCKSGGEKTYEERKKHSFGLLRMLTAGVLFLLLLFAFHFDFSYKGWDKESVQELLADDSQWNQLVQQVSAMIKK